MAWGLLSSGPHIAKGWSRVPQLQDAKINTFIRKAVRMGLRSSCLPIRGPKHVVPGETGTVNLLIQETGGAQGGLETVL